MKALFIATTSLLVALASTTALVACSSDDSNANPGPNPLDASADTSSSDSSPAGDTGVGTTDASLDGAPTQDATPCSSDAATCNSCVTPQQDPLHACSPASANCVPFDNTRVPANVPSP